MNQNVETYSLWTEEDTELFKTGKHYRLYKKLGSHTVEINGQKGVYFAVWAPFAKSVSVMGNWNGWNPYRHKLNGRWDQSGIWEGVILGLDIGEFYKYCVTTQNDLIIEKSDPMGIISELPPKTASIVGTTWYQWSDDEWMQKRKEHNGLDRPWSVYEMHLGSWRRDPDDSERFMNYREIAASLVPYIKEMGFTHVEFMPVMEHPYYPSWGYQITGYYAASSRYGGPQDLMYLIEELHKNDIGVIVDWVPSHFPGDSHGLYRFDGTALYEHEDPRKGFHPDWQSYIFNYGRPEVRSFLISNAVFWFDRYHVDGMRVDAVASMLYLDYSRKEGEWIPNEYGGNENLEAISFLKEFNEVVYTQFPDVQTIAEESTSWPQVSRPVAEGGLGFGMKWMMGWMHDTLDYFAEDPLARKYHHQKITFAAWYAFSEHFMLPLSHDEVVHGKKSLIYKMFGSEWQKFANLRSLYLYMYTFMGAKLLFMGGEFGQTHEWNENKSMDWHLLKYPAHKGLQKYVKELNQLYKNQPALYEKAFSPEGFEWIEFEDKKNSVFAYTRKGHDRWNDLVIVLNLTPVIQKEYRLGVPAEGVWEVIFNSDLEEFHGSGMEHKAVKSEAEAKKNFEHTVLLTLPPLSGMVFKLTDKSQKDLEIAEIERAEREAKEAAEKALREAEIALKEAEAKKKAAQKARELKKKSVGKKADKKESTKKDSSTKDKKTSDKKSKK